ncbi:MAG: hypothetical protein J0L72_04125 [Armatimonadetes bacterium]|nr:hypothetical protein [Armatimonadota bacterium]
MSNNVEKITKALKLKANPKTNVLTLKVGAKKYTLPFEVRMLSSESNVFVHIPPSAMLFKVEGKEISPVETDADAKSAQASFRKGSRTGAKRSTKTAEIPAEVMAALSKIPAGHKLAFDANGNPRLVKARKRRG